MKLIYETNFTRTKIYKHVYIFWCLLSWLYKLISILCTVHVLL
jgi:hypothetical protein